MCGGILLFQQQRGLVSVWGATAVSATEGFGECGGATAVSAQRGQHPSRVGGGYCVYS